MSRTRVYSVNAKEDLDKQIIKVNRLLEDIKILMGKYESLTRCHYGHVGDLGHVENLLGEAYAFLAESED
jgi:hypothetical protein